MDQHTSLFFLGIKGVGQANLAQIVKKMGKKVTGADTDEEFITDKYLQKAKIPIQGFTEELPKDTDLVVYSAAHEGSSHPLVLQAEKQNIRIMNQAELIQLLSHEFMHSIAVCGTHGKTTTTSLLVQTLFHLGKKPTYMVGTSDFSDMPGGDYSGDEFFVYEADEYVTDMKTKKSKLYLYNPDYVISTTVDFDHPDVFSDLEEVKQIYQQLFTRASQKNSSYVSLFLNNDDESTHEMAKQLPRETYLTYGTSYRSDFLLENIAGNKDGITFTMNKQQYSVPLYGNMNALNTAAVISFLLHSGFSSEAIQESLTKFKRPKRRMELVAYDPEKNIYLFDDYGHHPEEIKATLQATRMHFSDCNIILIFQPHTYSRTEKLKEDFVKSFALANRTFVLPIFASARELKGDITSEQLADLATQSGVYNVNFCLKEEVVNQVKKHSKHNTIIFTMGAGDVYKLGPELKKKI